MATTNNTTTQYDARTNALKTIFDKLYFHELPSYGNKIFYGLGFLALTCLSVLAVTGIVLALMGQHWWLYTVLGVYARSVHLWAVQALIVVLIMHGVVGLTTSGFRAPRRMVWAFGALMFSLILFQTEFGFGLRGDFSSQFRATSGADFWNGAYLGWWINPLSHMQEFAIHVAIIPFIIFVLFIMHYLLEHTYGIAKPYRKDIKVKIVPADHVIMYVRGIVLTVAILGLAYFFHSPYVPAIRISDMALQDPSLVSQTLSDEYDRTSDTATYDDSIDPYTFDTRQVFVVSPYEQLTGAPEPGLPDVMTSRLLPYMQSGAYEAVLNQEDPQPDTYTLRFLSDMDALETKAGSLNFDTEQWGMAKDETGSFLSMPPGSWWFLPLALLNSAFDLPNNDNGDRIAAEAMGVFLLVIIVFPYIPFVNRLPEFANLAPFIWRERKHR